MMFARINNFGKMMFTGEYKQVEIIARFIARTISFLDARWHFTFYILHFLQNKNKTLGTKYVLSTG